MYSRAGKSYRQNAGNHSELFAYAGFFIAIEVTGLAFKIDGNP